MISEITASFRQAYGKLPQKVRSQAKKAYRQWAADPFYPSLHYKKIHETLPIWSVRIDRNYRAVGIVQDKKMLWYFVGTHAEYERLIKAI